MRRRETLNRSRERAGDVRSGRLQSSGHTEATIRRLFSDRESRWLRISWFRTRDRKRSRYGSDGSDRIETAQNTTLGRFRKENTPVLMKQTDAGHLE